LSAAIHPSNTPFAFFRGLIFPFWSKPQFPLTLRACVIVVTVWGTPPLFFASTPYPAFSFTGRRSGTNRQSEGAPPTLVPKVGISLSDPFPPVVRVRTPPRFSPKLVFSPLFPVGNPYAPYQPFLLFGCPPLFPPGPPSFPSKLPFRSAKGRFLGTKACSFISGPVASLFPPFFHRTTHSYFPKTHGHITISATPGTQCSLFTFSAHPLF